LLREALARLADESSEATPEPEGRDEDALERQISLAEQRIGAVLSVLRATNVTSVLDLGCGNGKLLSALLKEGAFEKVGGADVSAGALEAASRRLHVDEMAPRQRDRLTLFQSALTYRDERCYGYDAIVLMEVVEHVDAERLPALERSVFGDAQPRVLVVTTPNVEYNVRFEGLAEGAHRHRDHRFEWTRAAFGAWADGVAERNGYSVRILPVGAADPALGSPTQMAVFER
jgi:3' terminal RNA ribose 2'-O-methyltransferase Hen1